MRNLILLSAILVGTLFFFEKASAQTTCEATCNITGKQFYFSFDRIDGATYREGMERCLRIPAVTEVMPVSAGSSRYMACFNYINRNESLSISDQSLWLAENELRKACEDKYRKGDWRGYDYTEGQLKNIQCK